MHARDIMTTAVVTVQPDTPVAEIARLLAGRGISAVPVIAEDGRIAGIVTEADLVRRLAGDDAAGRPGWFAGLLGRRAAAEAGAYARLHGSRASDVMTTALVAVTEDTPVAEIARLMEARKVKRVPVLRDGRLAGIVSRADLLGLAFAAPATEEAMVSDERIRRAVEIALREQPWADTYLVFPAVEGGIVTFHGYSRAPEVATALRVLAERVPGVRGVEMRLRPPPPFMLGVP